MKTVILSFLISILLLPLLQAQTTWYKYPDNPVLLCGPSGEWDDKELAPDIIIYENGTYRMWYDGVNSSGFRNGGLATSPDGTNWTKHPGNPVFTTGPDGSWDDVQVKIGSIIAKDSIYHLWYSGNDGTTVGPNLWVWWIGYATSSDSGITWTKHPQLVLSPGSAGEWDESALYVPWVIFESDTFKMWYGAGSASLNRSAIGYAWSLDGISWTKYNDPNTTNPPYLESDPVMMPEEGWDDKWNYYPCVMHNNGQFQMWYTGISSSTNIKAIGYATSTDGINWNKDTTNPIMEIGPPGSWDHGEVFSPKVILSGDTYKMWFGGWDGSYVHTGYAVDVTNIAHGLSLDIFPTYIPPMGDTLKISSSVYIPENHQVEVYALINGPSFSDSIQLSDNGLLSSGNNTFSGEMWLSGLQEGYFTVELKTNDLTRDFVHIYPFPSSFATTGPLKLDSIIYTEITNFRYTIKPYFRNYGTDSTISNIRVDLYSDDPWVTEIYPSFRIISSLAPGETKYVQPFAVTYDSATFPGYFNLRFEFRINNTLYWIVGMTEEEDDLPLPTSYFLEQNYPNPFNPSTNIKYSVPQISKVQIKIFDILGNEIEMLVNEEKPAGTYEVIWNADGISSGVYFYQLRAGSFIETKKMILMK